MKAGEESLPNKFAGTGKDRGDNKPLPTTDLKQDDIDKLWSINYRFIERFYLLCEKMKSSSEYFVSIY